MDSELIGCLAVITMVASLACLVYELLMRPLWKPNLRGRLVISAGVVYAVSWLVLTGSI